MMKFKSGVLFLLLPLLILFITGCGNDDDSTLNSNYSTSFIQSISPANGSTGVSNTTSISMTFSGPMDTMSVMDNFHLAGGDDMHDWMDSVSHNGGMGNMGMSQIDRMMDMLDSMHVSGSFHWNAEMDSCEYILSDSMMSNTEYMIYMDENEMMNHGGGMMGMGMNHNDDGYHEYHFTTGP